MPIEAANGSIVGAAEKKAQGMKLDCSGRRDAARCV